MNSEHGYVHLPLLSIGEAAKYMGVGRKMIYQLIEWGEIRVLKVRGSALVEKRSLEELKEGRFDMTVVALEDSRFFPACGAAT